MNQGVKVYVFILSFLFTSTVLTAQETLLSKSPARFYHKALSLYEQKNYGSALEMFDRYLNKKDFGDKNISVEDASFYAAECAVKLGEKDALYRLTSFSDHYPASAWIPVVNWSMGDIYFHRRRYYLALELFNKVNPKHLNKEQKAQYNYEKGFCLLKEKKTSAAIPLLQKAIQSGTAYAKPASYYYAYVQYQQKNYDEALKGFLAVKDDPAYKKQVPTFLMQTYYEQGKYDKVIDLGKSFLPHADRKSKAIINRILANTYYRQKKYTEAMPYFDHYVTSTRAGISTEEYYRMGITKYNTGHYNEAIPDFQRATSAKGVMAQSAWYYLGKCYDQTKQYRFAQNAWVSAFQNKTDSDLTAQSLFSYVNLTLREKGDPYRNPVKLVEGFIQGSDATAEQKERAAGLLVQLYMNTNNKQLAIAAIEKSQNKGRVLQSAYQQLTYQQAVSSYQIHRYRDALRYFQKALRYTTHHDLKLKTLFWLAGTEYQLRNYSEAIRYYKTFMVSKGAVTSPLFLKAYYGLGYAYFNEKRYPQAVEFFQRYLSRERRDKSWIDDAELRIADSYVMMEQYPSALKYYNRVIASGRSDAPYALYQKAYCYGVQGDFHSKVKTLQTLISRYRASEYYSNALFDMADTYSTALNQPRQAISYFRQLVREKPKSSYARKALVKMGLLYYKNNQNDQAITVLKQVISSYPASEEARVALSTLESIYKDQGNLNKYFAYAKTLNFVQVSHSQEDSLTFSVGEDAYLNGNYNRVISSLQSYLQQFPEGGFRLKAYQYLSESYARKKDTTEALSYYHKIIDFPQNDYTVAALIRAARMEYARKAYAEAYRDYHKLMSLTENASLKLEALDGSMRSAFLSSQNTAAADAAHQIMQAKGVTEDQLIYAHFVLAKTSLSKGDDKQAMNEFEITTRLSKGTLGAESAYHLAHLYFSKKEYKKAEKILFDLSDRYPNEVYWVAKGFILLADTYTATGNVFQARETLKSVLNNYPGADLKKIAAAKLDRLPKENKTQDKK